MKAIFLLLLTVLSVNAHVVFIADRQDGVAGDGTAMNPYDVSDPQKFNDVFRPLYVTGKQDVSIFVHPGTYDTWGSGDTTPDGQQGTYGFCFLQGWSITSLGPRAAKFSLVRKSGGAIANTQLTVFMTQHGQGNMRFSGLYIDANGNALNASVATNIITGIFCIYGRIGSNVTIEDCEFTDAWSDATDNGAAVWLSAILTHSKEINIHRNYVHDINVNCHGLVTSCNNEHTWSTSLSGAMRDNVLIGPGAIPLSMTQATDVLIENNYIDGWNYGLFLDTGFAESVTFRNNTIRNTHYSIYCSGGYYDVGRDQPMLWRCIFDGNSIYLKPSGLGIFLGDNCRNNIITRNRIYRTTGVIEATSGIYITGGGNSGDNVIRDDNHLDNGLEITQF